MKLNLERELDVATDLNTFPADVTKLNEQYTKETVDKAVHYLTYREVEELPKTEDPRHPILYVFRHGETQDNAKIIFSGWRDVDITENGIQQALVLADKLENKRLDMLYASDMIRAIDTMKHAISKNEHAKTLEIKTDRRLRERNYGDWQGYSKLKKHLEDPEGLHEVRRGYEAGPPNGESLHDTVNRVSEFLDELLPVMKSQNVNVAISCHGNSIRGIRQYFEKLNNTKTALIETPLGQDYAAYSVK